MQAAMGQRPMPSPQVQPQMPQPMGQPEMMMQPQQPQSPGRTLGQGVLSGILGGMFTDYNKIDQSEDAPWMSGMATGGLDDSLMKALQQYLGNKLF